MGKRGRRDRRRQEQLAAAEAQLVEHARAQGISVEEARARLLRLAEVREEYSAKLDGSGMEIADVAYVPAEDRIVVKVRPVVPERAVLARGRARVAQIELEETFGAPRSGLPFLGRRALGELLAVKAPRPALLGPDVAPADEEAVAGPAGGEGA